MNDSVDDLTHHRVRTVVNLSDDIVKSIVKQIDINGHNDPLNGNIVLAALTMSIDRINSVLPGFRHEIVKMLIDSAFNNNETDE